MRRLRMCALGAIMVVIFASCDAIDDETSPFDLSDANSTPTAGMESIALGSEMLGRSLSLLNITYAEPVEMPKLMAAGQRGAWKALAQSGLPPPGEVEYPALNAGLTETPQQFQARYQGIAGRYSSKTEPLFLAREMIRQAADSLDDCHTAYLSPKQLQDQLQRLSGTTRFGGVGVILRKLPNSDGFTVVEVFENGPAAKAGMRQGDLITRVDGLLLAGKGIEEVVNLVRGVEGSRVTLVIVRGADVESEMAISRASVSAPVLRSQILPGNVGYLRFYSFPEPLTGQVDAALREFEKASVHRLIVDLRDNSGGQLDVVTKVTSRFVPKGPLFQSINRAGERVVYQADGSYWKPPHSLTVLVNNGTGSGGEIFASAVQEHGIARLIGVASSGCVSTGQLFPLPDGSALEIATNRVVSGIRGTELNRIGVKPDETIQIVPEDLANSRDRQLDRAREIAAKS